MRKNLFLLTLLTLLLGGMTLNAQSGRISSKGTKMEGFGQGHNYFQADGIVCDTVDLGYPVDDTLVLYTSSGWGFVAGHNSYGDLSKAERVGNVQGFTQVLGAHFTFLYGQAADSNSKVIVHVWPEASGQPGTAIYSQDLLIQDIVAAQGEVYLNFTSPVTVSGPFYVGFSMTYAAGDTVGLASNSDGDTDPSTAWEEWSDNSWHSYDEAAGWNLKLATAIYPMVIGGVFPVVITPPNPSILSGGSVQLTAAGANTYNWYPSTGLSCTACSNPVASPTVTTTYTLVANLTGQTCPATNMVTVTVGGVAIEDNLFNGSVATYPNPNTGEFMLDFTQHEIANLQIGLFNTMGQQVYAEKLDNFSGNYRKPIDLSSVAMGVYTLRITDGSKQYVAKLVIE
jgi:hypothetical protein